MPNNQYQVLVVGAGPTGLSLACELAHQGIHFKIIDKSSGPSKTSKALGIHAKTLEIFEDMGIVDEFTKQGNKIHAVNVFARHKQIARLNLHDLPSHYNYILSLPQSKTEEILIEHLNTLGHSVDWNTECVRIEQDDSHVTAILQSNNQEQTFTAQYLVGADGSRSLVREQLKLPFDGAEYKEYFALGDFHLEGPYPPHEPAAFFSANGFMLLFPMGNSLYRIIANIEKDEERELSIDFFKELMGPRNVPPPTLTYKPEWFSKFTIHRRKVPNYRVNRAFLAGDSAHVHSPIGGQGMNTGIQDAYNLAWKLGFVLRGLAKESLLDTYNEEREPVGQDVLEMTHKMTSAITLKNPILRKLRNLLFPVITNLDCIRERLIASLGEVDINYRKTSLTREYAQTDIESAAMRAFLASPHPGDRAPNTFVSDLQTDHPHTLYQLLKGHQYKILIFLHSETDSHHLANIAQINNVRNQFSEQIAPPIFIGKKAIDATHDLPLSQTYLDKQEIAHAIYATHEPTLYLVRPDNYIAFKSIPVHPEKLEEFLLTHLQPS